MNNNNITESFTSFNYYKTIYMMCCQSCHKDVEHTLLRYRTFLSSKIQILPTRNTYFFICPNCGHVNGEEDELDLMKVLHKVKGKKPTKYNETLTLRGDNDDIVYTTILKHHQKILAIKES